METLYEYLLDNYKENEPIFLADLVVTGGKYGNFI